MAGPCAVESAEQMQYTAQIVKARKGAILRGGAFKPRSSPYSFQGLGIEGLKIMAEAATAQQLPTITEVLDVADIEHVIEYADAVQVGTRNMQNFRLLQAVGRCGKPVLLKRGIAASVKDLLMAAEYIVNEGNSHVMLCERGIRTFDNTMRNTLDLAMVPYVKAKSHLPVIVDPSHGTGIRELVLPMSLAAVACGADGIMVEVHPNPTEALSDGAQSLYPDQFGALMEKLGPFIEAAGKQL